MPTNPDWLTPQQAADKLQVVRRTIFRYIENETIPPAAVRKITAGVVRISAAAIEKLLS